MGWPDRQHPNAFLKWAVVLSYLPALGVASYTYALLRPAHRVPWRRLWRTPSTLPALMLCSIAFRLGFLFAKVQALSSIDGLSNRVAINLSFTVFALVASHWSRIATALSRHRSTEHPRLLLGFIMLVWLVDISTQVAVIADGTSSMSERGQILLDLPVSALFALFAALVLAQGLRMHPTFRKHGSLLLQDKATRYSVGLILRCTVGVSVLHLARSALFIASEARSHHSLLADILYPWCFYVVPETLEISFICLTLIPSHDRPTISPVVELDGAGVLREAGSDSRPSSSIGHPPLIVDAAEGSSWEQPLLEEWAQEDELLGSGTMLAIPSLLEEVSWQGAQT